MKKAYRFKEIDGIKYKLCSKCLVFKVLQTEFTKAKNTTDKRTPSCNECRRKIPQDQTKKRDAYRRTNGEQKRRYFQENKEDIVKKRKERLRTNCEANILNRVRRFVRKQRLVCFDKYPVKTLMVLGCSKLELFEYLKIQFSITYGIEYKDIYFKDLHIDHKIPLSIGKTEEDLMKLNHYTNLQFLHKTHNMQKKVKLDYIIPNFPLEDYNEEI